MKSMSTIIDENSWKRFAAKMPSLEAQNVFRQLLDYATNRLRSKIEQIKTLEYSIAFFTKGREFLTINVTRKGLRVYILPPAGAFFSSENKYEVEKISLWKSSIDKASGKYRAITFWISKESHLAGMKKLLDAIPV